MPDRTDDAAAATILIVDDDPAVGAAIADYLSDEGYRVTCAKDGAEMDRSLDSAQVDLILLDVNLPGEDGLSICRRIVDERGPPIIMLSAAGDEVDRVLGLELGADDYLVKPFSSRELLARVRAVLRRRAHYNALTPALSYRFGGFTLDVPRRAILGPNGVTILLSAGEVALVSRFAAAPRKVLSRGSLTEGVSGADGEIFGRALDVQISRLRRKLGANGLAQMIRTVRGLGYVFEATVTRA